MMTDTSTQKKATLDTQSCIDFCQLGRQTLMIEIDAIQSIAHRLNDSFSKACEYLLNTQGKIIVLGMGKSGHIAHKIAATLASTGSPAFFIHPAEARHGDLGMISAADSLLILSSSGETEEILTLLPSFKRLGLPLISLTGNPHSTLAKAATLNLDVSVEKEACPLNLAPTASTTAALAMGDAIAVALLKARGFTSEAFALSHPGGQLGRRLLLKVSDLMRTDKQIPIVSEKTTLSDALIEMSEKRLGLTVIVDDKQKAVGIFTDGDLRRVLQKSPNLEGLLMGNIIQNGYKSISGDALAIDALKLMENNKITSLLIINENRNLDGILHMHDLLEQGLS